MKCNKYMTQQEYNSRYKILEKHFQFWKSLYNEYVNKREIHTNKFLRIKINSGNIAIEFYKHKLKKDENGMYYNCKMND